MSEPGIPLPHFLSELAAVLANQGIDQNSQPFNYQSTVTTMPGATLTCLLMMTTEVDVDTEVNLSSTDVDRVPVPDKVPVMAGKSRATFQFQVRGPFPTAATVLVIGQAKSFFPAPARVLTLQIGADLH